MGGGATKLDYSTYGTASGSNRRRTALPDIQGMVDTKYIIEKYYPRIDRHQVEEGERVRQSRYTDEDGEERVRQVSYTDEHGEEVLPFKARAANHSNFKNTDIRRMHESNVFLGRHGGEIILNRYTAGNDHPTPGARTPTLVHKNDIDNEVVSRSGDRRLVRAIGSGLGEGDSRGLNMDRPYYTARTGLRGTF